MDAVALKTNVKIIGQKKNFEKKTALENLHNEVFRLMSECEWGDELAETEKNLLQIPIVFQFVHNKKNTNNLFQQVNSFLKEEERASQFVRGNEIIMESIENICTHRHSFLNQWHFTKSAREYLNNFEENLRNIALHCLDEMGKKEAKIISIPRMPLSELKPLGAKSA